MRPYYYIHNQASSITIPTDPVTSGEVGESNPAGYTGTDMPIGGYKVTSDDGAVATNTSDETGAGSNF